LFRETQVTWLGLGAALLLAFNLPEPVARSTKSAVREVLAPYHSALATAGGWLHPRREKNAPPGAVSPAAADRQRLEILERENAELRRLLGFSRRQPSPVVACDVIARDGESGWWRTIRLNRGTRAGIGTNNVVVTEDGVVGIVREVSPHTADALLISDPGCRISVRCSRTGDFGLMAGGGVVNHGDEMELLLPADPGEMTYIPRESGIRIGDEIHTSGLGGVFPEGLFVGRVVKVEPARSGLYLSAAIQPAANLARLRRVLVITGNRRAATAGEEP
jgi:rod shape-determining protein MreC